VTSRPEPISDVGALVSSYEELRRFAINRGDGTGRGVGLTLFIRSGMAAWMSACAPLAPRPDASPRHQYAEQARVPADLRVEVAMVLAQMALSAHAQGVAP
jgi:hypothetical protein